MSSDAVTSIEGEHFLHRTLWKVVLRQIEHANNNRAGAFYDDLVAMVFASHTLEAYLNYCGEKLAPDIWANEREYFRREPYRGFDGKVRKVLQLVGLTEPPRNARPYSSVWLLKNLRDLIAHAKTERIVATYQHSSGDPPLFHQTGLVGIVSASNASMVRQDIREFIDAIHERARPLVGNDPYFATDEPLEGVLSYTAGTTRPLSNR